MITDRVAYERALLGSVMHAHPAEGRRTLAALSPNDFRDPTCALVVVALRTLAAAGHQLDPFAVRDRLRVEGLVTRAQSVARLAELLADAYTAADPELWNWTSLGP